MVEAANIDCSGVVPCNGTNGNDNMLEDNKFNQINGKGDDDNIDLRGNPDRDAFEFGVGEAGNDQILGGFGNDIISGDQFSIDPSACNDDIRSKVADKLVGGFCDDKMVHSTFGIFSADIESDGNMDYIDCWPGNDRVTINICVDGDIAVHCETVIDG